MQKPTVGRIVHYYNQHTLPGGELRGPFAAMITEAPKDEKVPVTLHIFYPPGVDQDFFDMKFVPFSETPHAGCWSWPPRES